MRRYQLDNDRKLDRALNGLVKLRRAAVVGVAGDPAPEGRSETEPEPVGTVEPESGPADGPEGEADTEVPPKAEGDSLEDGDPGVCGLPSSFGLDPSPTPGPELVASAVAFVAGEPGPAGIARRPEPPPNRRATPFGQTNCHAPPRAPDPMKTDGRRDSPLRLNSRRNPARPLSVMKAEGARKTSPAHRLMVTKRRETNPTPRPTASRSRQTNSAHRSPASRSRLTNSLGRGGSPTRVSRP